MDGHAEVRDNGMCHRLGRPIFLCLFNNAVATQVRSLKRDNAYKFIDRCIPVALPPPRSRPQLAPPLCGNAQKAELFELGALAGALGRWRRKLVAEGLAQKAGSGPLARAE